jgi:hypothetical protein
MRAGEQAVTVTMSRADIYSVSLSLIALIKGGSPDRKAPPARHYPVHIDRCIFIGVSPSIQ